MTDAGSTTVAPPLPRPAVGPNGDTVVDAEAGDYGMFDINEEESNSNDDPPLQDCVSELPMPPSDELDELDVPLIIHEGTTPTKKISAEPVAAAAAAAATTAPSNLPNQQSPSSAYQRTPSNSNLGLLYHRTNSSSNLLLMKRVGSCFFSVSGSVGSDLDLLDWQSPASAAVGGAAESFATASPSSIDEDEEGGGKEAAAAVVASDSTKAPASSSPTTAGGTTEVAQVKWNAVDVLYHDIMMNVFSYLPATDLASFAVTGLRPNYDVFYYLQLQLERALLLDPTSGGGGGGGGKGGGGRRSSMRTTVDLGNLGSNLGSNLGGDATGAAAAAQPFPSQSSSSSSTCPITVCGAGILSRLATLDRPAAEALVSDYRNSSPHPSSSSPSSADHNNNLALIALQRNLQQACQQKLSNATMKEKGAASCAVVFTVLGAANKIMESQCSPAQQAALLGCAGLGLVASRRYVEAANHGGGDGEHSGVGGGAALSAMARRMQNLLMTLPHPGTTEDGGSVFPRPIVDGLRHGDGEGRDGQGGQDGRGGGGSEEGDGGESSDSSNGRKKRRGKRSKRKGSEDSTASSAADTASSLGTTVHGEEDAEEEKEEMDEGQGPSRSPPPRCCEPVVPFSADPYEHLEEEEEEEKVQVEEESSSVGYDLQDGEEKLSSSSSSIDNSSVSSSSSSPKIRKRPTGSVGAYARVLRRATQAVTDHVRTQRREAYDALPDDQDIRTQLSTVLIDACSSDATLSTVRHLVRNSGIDVNGFYVGSDGTTQTSPLHTAAFNGATAVVQFLCTGIDEIDSDRDGGLADVNLVDDNGWTALHFAAGANDVEGIRLLASFGAKLTVEAGNGYTPYHWAERLSNKSAADELRRLGADDRFLEFKIMLGAQARQPLSFLANRFFALMPTAVPTNG